MRFIWIVRKRLYLSSYNKGFVCYAPDGKKVYHIHTGNSKLNNNLVLDFLEINNKLWITTDGGGINIMDLKTPPILQLLSIRRETGTRFR